MGKAPTKNYEQYLENWNVDTSTKPPTSVIGWMFKDSGGTWRYAKCSADGSLIINTS